jgi:hypothetical protein
MKCREGFEKSTAIRYNTFTSEKLTRMVYIITKKPTRSQKMTARIFSYAYYCAAYLFILTVRLGLVK